MNLQIVDEKLGVYDHSLIVNIQPNDDNYKSVVRTLVIAQFFIVSCHCVASYRSYSKSFSNITILIIIQLNFRNSSNIFNTNIIYRVGLIILWMCISYFMVYVTPNLNSSDYVDIFIQRIFYFQFNVKLSI